MRLPHASLLACGLLALTACGGKEQAQTPPPPEVGVIEARPQTVPLTRDLVGRLTPYRSADVRARATGVLLRRTYQEGSDVREGQVLFEIDPAPLQAALGVARGQLAQAEASYANARATAERARPRPRLSCSPAPHAFKRVSLEFARKWTPAALVR